MAGRSDADRRTRIRRGWEQATRWPLLALSALFVVAYSLLVLAPSPSGGVRPVLAVGFLVGWAAFVVDFVVRIALTAPGARMAYMARHRIDLVSVVLPLVRPFQLLDHLHATPGFRGNGGNALRSRVVVRALAYGTMFVYIVALTELALERPAANATIKTFGDSIWWACVTIATVGYGDFTPVTPLGRVLAVVLMAGGVVIIGTASALIVSYLSERISHRAANEGVERKKDRR